ncbi:hypothetical protein [Shigella dysenteriae]|uniref:hypothetical protein n=1 Tax=Shigella dysenteriae TaxID=622 RepID=UPI0028EE2E24|nr:hypothetical protein [Shigella dysenteriae]WNT49805.1 hypothetical protein PWP84_15125 [Shigella dysenteriae]
MNVNAGHERTSKARIIHQIQLIRGITMNIINVFLQNNHKHIFFNEKSPHLQLKTRHQHHK